MNKYFNQNNEQYKEARQRGKVLEVEKVITVPKTNEYTFENSRLACYICNNAKSDFIAPSYFKPIAHGIYQFWKNKVGIEEIHFPQESDIWTK